MQARTPHCTLFLNAQPRRLHLNAGDFSVEIASTEFTLINTTSFQLKLPALYGLFTLDRDSKLTIYCSAISPRVQLGPVLQFNDFQATLDVEAYLGGESSEGTKVEIQASANALIGGEGGFQASIEGAFKLDDDGASMALTVSHPGGWQPIEGYFGELLTTPSFLGSIEIGPGDHLFLTAEAQFLDEVRQPFANSIHMHVASCHRMRLSQLPLPFDLVSLAPM